MTKLATDSGILPVIIGGDAGAYALGLEAFEAFGNACLCIANSPVDLITRSEFFEVMHIPAGANDSVRMRALDRVKDHFPERELLLLTNSDSMIDFTARNRRALEKHYKVPFPSEATVRKLSDKASFAKICSELGISTPRTVVVDLSEDVIAIDVESEGIRFPVVGKPAEGREYERLVFPGKKKIWFFESEAELNELWNTLHQAGFRGKFLIQEMIPGDDTQMRSLTFYVDSSGRVTLKSAARVLLQDPSPTMIGNPIAMITGADEPLWDSAEKILKAGNYRGFANFDIKVDPRDGTAYFLEVNPRIGRNCYYVVAAGANPMSVMGKDLFEGERAPLTVADSPALYTLVPVSLIKQQVTEPSLLREVKDLVRQRRVVNPLESPIEKNLRRRAVVLTQKYNYFRKFRAHRDELR